MSSVDLPNCPLGLKDNCQYITASFGTPYCHNWRYCDLMVGCWKLPFKTYTLEDGTNVLKVDITGEIMHNEWDVEIGEWEGIEQPIWKERSSRFPDWDLVRIIIERIQEFGWRNAVTYSCKLDPYDVPF